MSSVLVVRAIDRRILDLSPQNSVSHVRESWPIPATACRILLGELPRVLERHEAASAVTHPDTDVILAPHKLVAGKEFMFGDRGETALRGFDDPVRLFEVRWRE